MSETTPAPSGGAAVADVLLIGVVVVFVAGVVFGRFRRRVAPQVAPEPA